MFEHLAGELRDEQKRVPEQHVKDNLQVYIDAADRLSKAKESLLRFWRVTDSCGSDRNQTLYLVRIDKTPRGNKLEELLNLLDENDILHSYMQCALRAGHAPRGKICKALANMLQARRPKKREKKEKK